MSGSGPNSSGASSTLSALQGALAAEHATIWGYGVVGAHLSGAARGLALAADATHRVRRDALAATIRALPAVAVAAEPAYALPFLVASPGAALQLATFLESRTAASWRAVLAATSNVSLRRTALAALTDDAVRATRWRTTARNPTVTVPFPGQS